ncbi:class I SAM-dependent methyltransferase [Alkaliphilus pronyensis]|uniref:Class I SAM-dependent methyltransferase n=1 Tax=Alkaliphilus pronyensis TaxID=1482732 RepID=A0A6I0FFG4_9FIRM|nr:class I SAM-dependent methyltransferase [Alkaliphilus pronyensis]KAB3534711.1 class I SAM-dependent methyltransferase [Alkaliphilus pronyensis]
MSVKTTLCKGLNKLFPLPVHPFNLKNEGLKTYGQWQFQRGEETLRFYLEKATKDEILKDKVVLDIGCGAAGKTLYYAAQGAKKVYGIEVVERYEEEAKALAKEKGLEDRFQFISGDAAKLPFQENHFDTIIMNDAMEHVDKPLQVLNECYRVLKPKGRLYVNFPPYYHPFGAHLSDAIGFPWVHLFFDDKTLIEVYKDKVKNLPDGEERINFRIARDENGNEYFSYINGMTIKWFNELLHKTNYKVVYYREVPLRSFFTPLAKLPLLKEGFVKMVVGILEK